MIFRAAGCRFAASSGIRTTAILCAYLFATFSLTACNQGVPPAAKDRTIAPGTRVVLLVTSQTDPRQAAMIGGAARVAAERPNLKLEVAQIRPVADYAREFDEILKSQPAVIVIPSANERILAEIRQATLKTGIVLITYGETNDPPERVGIFGHVSTDRAAAAELLGRELSNFGSERKSYVLVQSAADARNGVTDRFRSGVGSRVGPVLLSDATYGDSNFSGPDAIRSLLAQFPNTTLAVTLDESLWLESPPGLLLGEHQVMATLGVSPLLWGAVREHKCIAMVGVLDGDIGEAIVRMVFGALLATEKGPLFRAIPNEVVTPDLLERFEHRYAAAAGMPVQRLNATTQPASNP